MLVQFLVKNHRSIRDEAVISFYATKDKSLDDSLIALDSKKQLLPVIAVYGANAAGKSNLLHAIVTMQSMVTGECSRPPKGESLPWEPFGFRDTDVPVPTHFEAVFIYKGIKYAYGYSFNDKSVVEEYLYHWPNGREALVFSRNERGYEFRENVVEQNVLAGRTPDNRLYLVSSNEWNCPQTEKAFSWFRDCVVTNLAPTVDPLDTLLVMDKSKPQRARVLRELLLADLGISDVQVMKSIAPEIKRIIMMTHRTTDGNGNIAEYQLPLEKESAGTQRFFSRIGSWISVVEQGKLLVIDEIEASMHPLLTRRLVAMIQDTKINTKGAQLLFTTHDTGLLDLSLLRRDQIWFVERDDKCGATVLYALTDFSPRKGENIQKGYLQGRFGAIPFVRDGGAGWEK